VHLCPACASVSARTSRLKMQIEMHDAGAGCVTCGNARQGQEREERVEPRLVRVVCAWRHVWRSCQLIARHRRATVRHSRPPLSSCLRSLARPRCPNVRHPVATPNYMLQLLTVRCNSQNAATTPKHATRNLCAREAHTRDPCAREAHTRGSSAWRC
jgi:hypothetical protein